MNKTNETIVLAISNVRVVKQDDRNYRIDRQENNKEGQPVWKFKGYAGTIKGALKIIVLRELLVETADIYDLETHLEAVEEAVQHMELIAEELGVQISNSEKE